MVSVWHQSTAWAIRKHRIRLLSYRSRGTLMSYTDHSAQRRCFSALFTHNCIPVHGSNSIIKFADDTTVVGLISGNDEMAYRDEVQHLATWCANNNLALNTQKTKELKSIIKDPSHPNHRLFTPLPSGRRYRSLRCHTSRLRNSFFPSVVRLQNSNLRRWTLHPRWTT